MSTQSWKSIDPITGAEKETFSHVSPAQIESTISELHQSYQAWSKLKISDRQVVLKIFQTKLEAEKETLAKLITEEMGKPIKESTAEVKKCIDTISSYLAFDYSFLENQTVHSIYKESRIQHHPLGIIYGIMPWNFPLYQAVRMFIPPLLAGNVVLLKHSEVSPKMGQLLDRLFQGVWTESLFHHILASSDDTEKIMADPRVNGVSLTGSVKAGFSVSQLAGKYLKKSVFELGGSDPCLILADADLKAAAQMVAKARLMNTGQSCICIKRCLVDRSVLPQFLELVKAEFSKYKFGNPSEKTTDLGPLAHPRFKVALKKQLEELRKHTGAEKIFSLPHGQTENGAYVDAEIYLLNKNSDWLRDQEFFGPILLVIPFANSEEGIAIANSTEFALGASLWSTNLETAKQVADKIFAGQVTINDMVKSDMTLPFGGFKASGLGRELGVDGFMEFTQTKVISYS
ncbi:MAG: aldehyde dehydrogenase family protein [Bdellovibrio sp.]|nr:aldehyde dehydrogenase family protein [Bdellovibrio sp.]